LIELMDRKNLRVYNLHVQERLTALASRLEAITLRIRTIGLTRAAEDLKKLSLELRCLGDDASDGKELATARDAGLPDARTT
jgi:hypothetical protein